MQTSQQNADTTPAGTTVTSAPEGFIGKTEVARRLGKTTRTIEVWATKKRFLPYLKVGRSILFKWSDVEASLLQNHGINCPPR